MPRTSVNGIAFKELPTQRVSNRTTDHSFRFRISTGNRTLAEFAVGVVVILFAIGLIQHHRESYRVNVAGVDSEGPKTGGKHSSQNELEFLRTRNRRRMIASSLICLVGVLFVIDSFVDEMFASVIMMMLILMLMPVLCFFAMLDFYRSQKHFRTEIQDAADAKRTLIAEAERLRLSLSQDASRSPGEESNDDVESTVKDDDS